MRRAPARTRHKGMTLRTSLSSAAAVATATTTTTITKPRPTPHITRRNAMPQSSPFFERLAEEKSTEMVEVKKTDYRMAELVASAVVSGAFELSAAISQYFDTSFRRTRQIRNVIEDLGDGLYVCRFFLKNATLPDAFKMEFGPHHGLKPGVAICRVNAAINSEEKSIVRKEWNKCLRRDDILSPGVICPWFAKEITKVLKLMRLQEDSVDVEETKEADGIVFRKADTGVTIYIWRNVTINSDSKPGKQCPERGWRDKPLEVAFVPCIRGAGWPGGVHLQHAFPRQKPFVKKGTDTIRHLANIVEDGRGYDLWLLEPWSIGDVASGRLGLATTDDVHWKVSLRSTIRILLDDLTSGLRDPELDRKVDVVRMRGVVEFLKRRHRWSAFTGDVIDSAILWSVKRHLLNVRVTSDMCIKVLEFLLQVAQTRSCPLFLMPNLNIFHVDDLDEVKRTEKQLRDLLTAVSRDDSYFLKYLGYKTKTELRQERKRQLYNHVNRVKIRSALLLMTSKKADLYE